MLSRLPRTVLFIDVSLLVVVSVESDELLETIPYGAMSALGLGSVRFPGVNELLARHGKSLGTAAGVAGPPPEWKLA